MATVDRSAFLDQFMAAGIVSSLQELNGMGQSEFDEVRQLVDSRMPIAPQGEDVPGGLQDPDPLPDLTIEQRISALAARDGGENISQYLDQGREIAHRLLAAHNEKVRPRILQSGLAALRV
jgi:hypothetical protein